MHQREKTFTPCILSRLNCEIHLLELDTDVDSRTARDLLAGRNSTETSGIMPRLRVHFLMDMVGLKPLMEFVRVQWRESKH